MFWLSCCGCSSRRVWSSRQIWDHVTRDRVTCCGWSVTPGSACDSPRLSLMLYCWPLTFSLKAWLQSSCINLYILTFALYSIGFAGIWNKGASSLVLESFKHKWPQCPLKAKNNNKIYLICHLDVTSAGGKVAIQQSHAFNSKRTVVLSTIFT